ncbi:MAG TPA: hypothetical protein VGN33_05890 [Leifsonia sp.]|nr:hypothetical protein [Leifsonia sp.]
MPQHINLNNDWHFDFGEHPGAELVSTQTRVLDLFVEMGDSRLVAVNQMCFRFV